MGFELQRTFRFHSPFQVDRMNGKREVAMTRIMLDPSTLGKWRPFMSNVFEICDPLGKVIGHFCPTSDPALYQNVHVPFSETELDAFEQEAGGRSLPEILKDMPQ